MSCIKEILQIFRCIYELWNRKAIKISEIEEFNPENYDMKKYLIIKYTPLFKLPVSLTLERNFPPIKKRKLKNVNKLYFNTIKSPKKELKTQNKIIYIQE